MISNERPFRYGGASRRERSGAPTASEDVLKTERIQIEQKVFVLTLRENPRGRFLRVTEEANGRFNSIIIPSTGLDEFADVLRCLVESSGPSGGAEQPEP